MGRQVDLRTAAQLTGRSEWTIRTWARHGELHAQSTGRKHGAGFVRLFDVVELEAVNQRHGGTWRDDHARVVAATDLQAIQADVSSLKLQIAALRMELEALRQVVGVMRSNVRPVTPESERALDELTSHLPRS